MTAEQSAGARYGQAGQAHRLTRAVAATAEGRREEGRRRPVGSRVHHADPQVLLMLLSPVRRAGQGSWPGRCQTDDRQPAGSALSTRTHPDKRSRQPRSERHLHEHRMERMTQPDAVQHVTERAGHEPDGTLQRPGETVKRLRVLKAGDRIHEIPAARLHYRETATDS